MKGEEYMSTMSSSNTGTTAITVFGGSMSSTQEHDLVLWLGCAWQHHGHVAVITIASQQPPVRALTLHKALYFLLVPDT